METDQRSAATEQLAAELARFARLAMRMRAMLSTDAHGADHSALLLLVPLAHEGPLRVRDLAEIKHADPSTISRQAAQLVRAGLVLRQADPVDGRASRLALTAEGAAAYRRLQDARRDLIAAALHDWPDEQVTTFTDMFREFNGAVEASQRDSAPAMTAAPPGTDTLQEST